CGDSGTGGSGGGSNGGGDTGGNPGTGGTPDTGGSPEGGAPEGGAPAGGSPGEGGAGGGASSFNLSFDGSGFAPHNDQNLYVQVLDAGGNVVASDMAVVSGGTFSFDFTNVDAEGGSVDYYAPT
ncbi:MAG: hypothetical protein JNK04_16745, partial [Myxococcales bacterium]|nr:hypothetical protein [Myxococcales bacterium]